MFGSEEKKVPQINFVVDIVTFSSMYPLTGNTSIMEALTTSSGSIESIMRGQVSNIFSNAMKDTERMEKQVELNKKNKWQNTDK